MDFKESLAILAGNLFALNFINGYYLDLAIALAIFLFFLLLRKIFVKYILRSVLRLTAKTGTELDTAIVLAFEKPLGFFLMGLGLYLGTLYLPLPGKYDYIFLKLLRILVIICLAWGISNFTGSLENLFEEMKDKFNLTIDKILMVFFSRVIKYIVLFLAFMLITSELGYDISGFIAGLGLGGLAFALAAQDTASNIFGGIVIIMDKPFSIGDWIETPSVEGTVEDINFRSSKVRTFANALVTVPNSTLANEAIINWTRMGKRRVTFSLALARDTSREKLRHCVDRIQGILRYHAGVHQETIFCGFDRFNESSLDLLIYFFTKTTAWKEYLEVKEDINFQIMAVLEEAEVSLAYPSRSIYLETPGPDR